MTEKLLTNKEFLDGTLLEIIVQIYSDKGVGIRVKNLGLICFTTNCDYVQIEPFFLSAITIGRLSNVVELSTHDPFRIRVIRSKYCTKSIISKIEV